MLTYSPPPPRWEPERREAAAGAAAAIFRLATLIRTTSLQDKQTKAEKQQPKLQLSLTLGLEKSGLKSQACRGGRFGSGRCLWL